MPVNVRAERFPLFDSLRAIAAIAVLATHAAAVSGVEMTPGSPVRAYAARLEVGVAIFFAISGFLLYRPFVVARIRGVAAPAAGPYAWRRFLRIVPAYWVALTAIALWLGLPGVFSTDGLVRYYGIAQAYDQPIIGGLAQAWSLTVEVAFYAFLPLYAFAVSRLARRRGLGAEVVGLGTLVLVATAWKLVALGGVHGRTVVLDPVMAALPSYLDHFAVGMGLAILSVWLQVHARDELPPLLRAIDARPALAWGFALVAFWAVSTQIGLSGTFFEPASGDQHLARHYLYAAVALGVVTPAVVGDPARGLVRRLLGARPLLWLGLVSYGIFLWNLAVVERLWDAGLDSVPVVGTYAGLTAVGLAVTAAVAAASYYLVERPALRLKRLFGDQRPASARGEAVEERAPVSGPPARVG